MYKKLIYNGIEYSNFEIDEYGNIKNLKTNHIYKFSTDKSGYLRVCIPMGKRGKVKIIRVHKAVAETYIPNPYGLPSVHHKDENKMNPHVSNLQWVNHKQNTNYHWRKESEKTEMYNNRKLSSDNVKYIRAQKGLISSSALARKFNVSKTTIINVQNSKFYVNIA